MHKSDDHNEHEGDTLEESVLDSLGAAYRSLLPDGDTDPQFAFPSNWRELTHAQLAELKGRAIHDRGTDFQLRYPGERTRAQGVLAWDRELIQQDLAAERQYRKIPSPIGAPRLFLSYRWSDLSTMQRIDFFAGSLFNRGYDIIFDRDPRHIDKGLKPGDLLLFLPSCTHFVALLTEEYTRRIIGEDQNKTSPACQEWAWAARLSNRFRRPEFMGIWLSGERLPNPFTVQNVLDFRESGSASRLTDRVFPICQFVVVARRSDDSGRAIGPIERRSVRGAFEELESVGEFEDITVHNVTRKSCNYGNGSLSGSSP
jgi:hypothetical protein